jgi:hypothetical protein
MINLLPEHKVFLIWSIDAYGFVELEIQNAS